MTLDGLTSHTVAQPREAATENELPAMFAALCSCEHMFGPYHPQTLRLMVEVGVACVEEGEAGRARCLLTRASSDLSRTLGPDHEIRIRAIEGLRDLFVRQAEWKCAEEVQREVVECHTRRFGPDHFQTVAARAKLAQLIFDAPLPVKNNRET